MKNKLWKQLTSGVLALALTVSSVPVSVFATEADTQLCEHHTSHTLECGYREAVEGKDCNHQHTQDCYVKEQCIHTHEESCGADGVNCTHECKVENACLTIQQECIHVEHDANCGMFDEENPVCNHGCQVIVDSEESCYALLCSHAEPDMHDDLCGYAKAISASDCEFVCEQCVKAKTDALAVANVKALVDVLPTVDEVKDMDREEQLNAYNRTQEAYDAFKKLLGAQKAELPDAEAVFEGLFEYFNGLVNEINESTGGTCGENLTWEYDAATSTLIISGSGAMDDFTVVTTGKTLPNYPWEEYISQIVKVELPDGLTKIGNYAFYRFGCLEEITLPDSLEVIGENAFYSCLLLDEIVIPNSVTSIGVNAFAGCRKLKNITIPDGITRIEDSTFNYCRELEEITLPDGLKEIGFFAFEDCEKLNNVVIPEGVTSIGRWTFSRCSSLSSIVIPGSVTNLGMQAFADCSNLVAITFEGSAPVFDDMDGFAIPEQFRGVTASVCYPANDPSWTAEIMQDYGGEITWKAIEHGHNYTAVVTPPTCTDRGYTTYTCECKDSYVGEYVDAVGHRFGDWYEIKAPTQDAEGEEKRDCENCDHYETQTKDKIPFDDGLSGTCGENLTWTLVNSVLTITGEGAMAEYDHYLSSPKAPWHNKSEEITQIVIADGVTSIGQAAFDGCYELQKIEIPNSITSIGSQSFYGCSNLTQIHLPEGITVIPWEAFAGCSSLDSIQIPDGVTSIEMYAFYHCSSLAKINIPKAITSIGSNAFNGCSSLSEITIPEGVPAIESGTFEYCNSLVSIDLPTSITRIDGNAFSGCSSLQRIDIPSGVTHISVFAFASCYALKEISIPTSVSNIAIHAFNRCWSLADVYYAGSKDEWANIEIAYNKELTDATIHYNSSGSNDVFSPAKTGTFRNRTYEVYDISMTWTEAKEYCENLGGHLVTITSAEEQAFIEKLLPEPCTKKQYWLGMLYENDVYRWITDEDISYTNWDAYEPDKSVQNGEMESYIHILNAKNPTLANGRRYAWNDMFVNNVFEGEENFFNENSVGFICEYDAPMSGDVRYFRRWDENTKTAYWGEEPPIVEGLDLGSQVTAETDTSFIANVDDLVGTYVLAATKTRDDGMIAADILLSIKPLETETGSVTAIGFTTITIDGVEYSIPENVNVYDLNVGDSVMYHLYNGDLVGINGKGSADDDNDDSAENIGTVRYYSGWDIQSRTVTFGRDIQSMATVADDADASLVNSLNSLQGNYVLVEIKEWDGVDELVSILPVESIAAKVEYVSSILAKITICGTEYPVSSGDLVSNVKVDDYVLFHIYGGEVIAVEILQELTGKLMGWDKNTREVSIALDNEPDLGSMSYSLSNLVDAASVEVLNKLSSGNTTIVTPIQVACDEQGFLYCVKQLHTEIKVYMPYPVGIIGVGEDVEILLDMCLGETTIPVNEGYTVRIDDEAVVQEVENQEPDPWNNTWTYRFKGIRLGTTQITFIDNTDSNNLITIPITVGENLNYYKCTSVSPELESVNGIHIANYQCEDNGDGTHTIKFDAYNTYYSYAVVEIYNQEGGLESVKPIAARSDSSGIKLVKDYLYYGFVEPFDLSVPWYAKKSHSKHTPIILENIPENAKIRITGDGNESAYVTLYTGVDIFTDVLFAASSLLKGTSDEAKEKTVEALVMELVDKISATMIKKIADNLCMVMLEGSTADITSSIYKILYNEFLQVNIDFGNIVENQLTNYGYAVADTIGTKFIPEIKIANLVVNMANIGWKITHFSLFTLDSGSMEVFVTNHNIMNHLVNNNVSVKQNSNFEGNTILDAYVVVNNDELKGLPSSATNGLVNYIVYNITLRKNGAEIQPNGEIEVSIPIPEGAEGNKCSVYRIEANGERTLLPTRVEEEYLVFTTTHLSYYIIGELLVDDPSPDPHIHSYTSVIFPPKCTEKGYTTYSCTCGDTYVDNYVDPAGHSGGTATCTKKAVCAVCGTSYGELASHDYETKWNQGNTNGHWHECKNCTAHDTQVKHTSGAAATETTAQICTECGYVIVPATGHVTHTAGSKWFSDGNSHWHKCTGCNEKLDVTTHSGGTATCTKKAVCSTCGTSYGKLASHDYETSWSQGDANGHWHECKNCSAHDTQVKHTPGAAATETTAQFCTVCDYVITPALGHTCTAGSKWYSNGTYHWHVCTSCGAWVKTSYHSYSGDTDETCNVCGYTRTVNATEPTEETEATIPETTENTVPAEAMTTTEINPTIGSTEGSEILAGDNTPEENDSSGISGVLITAFVVVALGTLVALAVLLVYRKRNKPE